MTLPQRLGMVVLSSEEQKFEVQTDAQIGFSSFGLRSSCYHCHLNKTTISHTSWKEGSLIGYLKTTGYLIYVLAYQKKWFLILRNNL